MKARNTYMIAFEASDLATLQNEYDTWRLSAAEAEVVSMHYQADGGTFTLLVFYAQ